jgi:hypothetical protein
MTDDSHFVVAGGVSNGNPGAKDFVQSFSCGFLIFASKITEGKFFLLEIVRSGCQNIQNIMLISDRKKLLRKKVPKKVRPHKKFFWEIWRFFLEKQFFGLNALSFSCSNFHCRSILSFYCYNSIPVNSPLLALLYEKIVASGDCPAKTNRG